MAAPAIANRRQELEAEEEREYGVHLDVRGDRSQWRPGGIGQADGTVLEAGVDAGLLDFVDQLLIEGLIGVGFALDGLVLERMGVEAVELGLDLRHGLLEHVFAIGGFLELEADALFDVGAQGSELAFQLGDLGESLLVLGVVGAVLGLDTGKLLAGLIEAVGVRAVSAGIDVGDVVANGRPPGYRS